MNHPKTTIFLLAVFIGLFNSPANAQVNLKTGYNISILSIPGVDRMVASYNETQPYSSPFKKLSWLHGLEAGLRYKADLHAVELTYQAAYQTLKATGNITGQEYTDKMKFAIHNLAIGYQVADRAFGAGTDLQYQFYRVKFTPGLNENVFRNDQNMLALKFYFMIILKGGKGVDMSIQPYFILPFESVDLSPTAQYLQVELTETQARWKRFGLSVLFYNGEK